MPDALLGSFRGPHQAVATTCAAAAVHLANLETPYTVNHEKRGSLPFNKVIHEFRDDGNRDLTVLEAARFLLSEEEMDRFVELYRHAAASGDEWLANAADEALRNFRDSEATLTRMLAPEEGITRSLAD